MTERAVCFKAMVINPLVNGKGFPIKGTIVTIIRELNQDGILHWKPKDTRVEWWYASCFKRLDFNDYYNQIIP